MQATDFVVRSQSSQCELARLSCGGHRRPFSFLLNPPCFAFIKDRKLHIHPPQHQPLQIHPPTPSTHPPQHQPLQISSDGRSAEPAALHVDSRQGSASQAEGTIPVTPSRSPCIEVSDSSSQDRAIGPADRPAQNSKTSASASGDDGPTSMHFDAAQQDRFSQAQMHPDSATSRLLHVPHHGREVLCGLLLPGPPVQYQTHEMHAQGNGSGQLPWLAPIPSHAALK